VAIFLALITNWIRVATIIYAGDATDMQHYLVTVDHYNFGWVLFGVSLIPFFFVANRLRPSLSEEPSGPTLANLDDQGRKVSFPILVLTIALLVAPAVYWVQRDSSVITGVPLALPSIRGWNGPASYESDWQPIFPAASGEVLGNYSHKETVVDVYLNTYLNQTQGRELIGYGNALYGRPYGEFVNSKSVELSGLDGQTFEARQIVVQDRQQNKRVILYWYLIGQNTRMSDTLSAKAYQAAWGLLGNHDAGLVGLSSRCAEDCGLTITTLTGFAEHAQTQLETEIQAARPDNER